MQKYQGESFEALFVVSIYLLQLGFGMQFFHLPAIQSKPID